MKLSVLRVTPVLWVPVTALDDDTRCGLRVFPVSVPDFPCYTCTSATGHGGVVLAFSSRARILGRMFDNSFPACAFFLLFFKVEISSCTLIPLFRPGSVHNGSASSDDCDRMFPEELRVSSFPDRFPHTALWHSWWPSDVAKHCVCFSSYTCTSTTGSSNACWHTFQSSGTARVRVCFTPKHTLVP